MLLIAAVFIKYQLVGSADAVNASSAAVSIDPVKQAQSPDTAGPQAAGNLTKKSPSETAEKKGTGSKPAVGFRRPPGKSSMFSDRIAITDVFPKVLPASGGTLGVIGRELGSQVEVFIGDNRYEARVKRNTFRVNIQDMPPGSYDITVITQMETATALADAFRIE